MRLAGLGDTQAEIEEKTGLKATRSFRKGDPSGLRGNFRKSDLWLFQSPLGEHASLDEHLQWLWTQVAPHREYFASLVRRAEWADVCLGCISESAYPVLSLEPESTELLRELHLGLSFNFTVS